MKKKERQKKGKNKKKKTVGFRRSAAVSMLILSMASRIFGTPWVEPSAKKGEIVEKPPQQQHEIMKKVETARKLMEQKPGMLTKVSASISKEALSDESKTIMNFIDMILPSFPYSAGMYIVDCYCNIPEDERSVFDAKFYEIVSLTEKNRDYDLAGVMCVDHITKNSDALSYNHIVFLLRTALREFKLAIKKLEKEMDNLPPEMKKNENVFETMSRELEMYKGAVDELRKTLQSLGEGEELE